MVSSEKEVVLIWAYAHMSSLSGYFAYTSADRRLSGLSASSAFNLTSYDFFPEGLGA